MTKPWHQPRMEWNVHEREPQFCGRPDSILFGPYKSAIEAVQAACRYGAWTTNTYIKLSIIERKDI